MNNKKFISRPNIKSVLFIILIYLVSPVVSTASETMGGPRKNYNLYPTLSAGVVYEYLNYRSHYKGIGLTIDYKLDGFLLRARYLKEFYQMTYFGASRDAALAFLRNGTGSQIVVKQKVAEKKDDVGIGLGFNVWLKNLTLFPEIRWISFDNGFSVMEIFGPALAAELDLNWKGFVFDLGLGGAFDLAGDIVDQRNDFVRLDGEKTISYYGEPLYIVNWKTMVKLPYYNGRFSFGYNGSVTRFKYVYRYSHGLTGQANF